MTNTTAASILQAGLKHMADRAATYDKPQGERSVPATVAAFNAITGHSLTIEQGWLFMALLKAVRAQSGAYKSDNYEDFAAYAGLMGEAAFFERGMKPKAEAPVELLTAEERDILKSLATKGERTPVGADLRFDQSGRQDAVEQNGNTGEHYKEPQRPLHTCSACGGGHALHKCAAGNMAELPNTDALVDPTGKPKWADAPVWANYLTQDSRGVWSFWQKEPKRIRVGWMNEGGMRSEVNSGKVVGDWRESLELAPGLSACPTEKQA